MEDEKYLNRHIAHFGAIAFNYSMFGFALTLGALGFLIFSWLFVAVATICVIVYYIFIGIGALFSLGLLLFSDTYRGLFNDNALEWVGNAGDFLNEISPHVFSMIPYSAIITAILCIVSFVCLMFDRKWEKSKTRLITLGVITGILIMIAILIFVGIISIKEGIA